MLVMNLLRFPVCRSDLMKRVRIAGLPGREYPVNVRSQDKVAAATDSSGNLATNTDLTLRSLRGMSMWNSSRGS